MGTVTQMARHKDIATLLFKHARGDLLDVSGLEEDILSDVDPDDRPERGDDPQAFVDDLESMGPTFIKLGQLLSSRPDLLPERYIEALERLHDDVDPFPPAEAREVVEEELGVSIEKAFASYDAEPFSAASLAQVHRATLRDGREVVVKVQRPGIRATIRDDLEVLDQIATLLERHTDTGRKLEITDVVREFRRSLLRELDFEQEARHLRELRHDLREYRDILIPEPVEDFTTSRVLTMQRVPGVSIDRVSPVVFTEIDRNALGAVLLRCYLDQILVHGAFHADPHPGNVLLTPDGRLGLVDLGMIARVDPETREHYLKLLLALSDGRGNEVAELSRELAAAEPDAQPEAFDRDVSDLVQTYYQRSVTESATGRIMLEVVRLALERGFRPPPSMSILGKTLLHLDQIARLLSPDLRPDEVIREHAQTLIERNLEQSVSPARLFASALEMNEFAQRLPGRVNKLLDKLVEDRLQIRVDAVDEVALTGSLRSIANRITLGLVLASLIIGAALLMRIETRFTILGYPGIAMIVFMLAAVLGLALVVTIARRDYWARDGS